MASPRAVLVALGDLERRYDGPIPIPLREAAIAGSAARRRLTAAEGQAAFFVNLIRDQHEALRRWRRLSPVPPELVRDLALYRRQWRWWCAETARRRAVTRSAGDAP